MWEKVAETIERNDVETAGRYKSAIEIGQRKMRDQERDTGESWRQRFFTWIEKDEVASELKKSLGVFMAKNEVESVGSWTFTPDKEDIQAIVSGQLFEGI